MRWIILSLLVATALSGCAAEEPTTFTPTTDVPEGNETAPDAASNGTVENGTDTAQNLVPELTFTADVVNGTAPLLVNFTVEAEDDSENLTWTFSVNGTEILDGTEVPATFNHTFETGAWITTVTISDGQYAVQDNLTIDVVDGAPQRLPIQELTIDYPGGGGGCGAEYSSWDFGLPAAGILYGEFAVDAATYGQNWTAEFTTDGNPALTMLGLDFYDADGNVLAGGAFDFLPTTTVGGVVPAGAVNALVYDCGAAGVSAAYTTDGLLA